MQLWSPFLAGSADSSLGVAQCFKLADPQAQHLTEQTVPLRIFPLMMLGVLEHGGASRDIPKGNQVTSSGDRLTLWLEKCVHLLPLISDG